jgi:hypothetical protein
LGVSGSHKADAADRRRSLKLPGGTAGVTAPTGRGLKGFMGTVAMRSALADPGAAHQTRPTAPSIRPHKTRPIQPGSYNTE